MAVEQGKEDEANLLGCWDLRNLPPYEDADASSAFSSAAKDLLGQLLSLQPSLRPDPASSSFREHVLFDGVDWDLVDSGRGAPPIANFDKRLGFLELFDAADEAMISAEDQQLFEGF